MALQYGSAHFSLSVSLAVMVKDCGHHDEGRKKMIRYVVGGVGGLIVVVLITIFVIYLILRPTKPNFILLETTVYAFNLSTPNTLSSTFQVTLSSRNPNDRVGIYYDRLDIYLSYRGQQISLPTLIPSTYQGHKDINVWSPFLYGPDIPVAPYLSEALVQDQYSGTVLVNVKVDGRVRFKVGTFISGKYHLFVSCPSYIDFRDGGNAIPVGPGLVKKFKFINSCHVDV